VLCIGLECTLNDSNGVSCKQAHTVTFDSNEGSGKPALNCDIFGDHVTSLITKNNGLLLCNSVLQHLCTLDIIVDSEHLFPSIDFPLRIIL
jgi:hypothetical protein